MILQLSSPLRTCASNEDPRGGIDRLFVDVDLGTVYLARSASGEDPITFADLNVGDDVVVFARRGEDPGDPLIARAVFVLP